MPALTAEVLRAWRASEQLLDVLPPVDPDHETVRLLVLELRELYSEVASSSDRSHERVRATIDTLNDAWLALDAARARINYSRPDGGRSPSPRTELL